MTDSFFVQFSFMLNLFCDLSSSSIILGCINVHFYIQYILCSAGS